VFLNHHICGAMGDFGPSPGHIRRTCILLVMTAACASFSALAPARNRGRLPDSQQLRAAVEALVGFGTRHTLSDTTSPRRGIGAARRWAQPRFEQISHDCGSCLVAFMPAQSVTGARLPNGAEVVDVVAIQKGSGDPDRVVVLTGHIDSRVSDR
jgi:hypothetical protein